MNRRLPRYIIQDYVANDVKDSLTRQYIGQSQDYMAIGTTTLASSRGRIKSLTMTGSAGTTVDVYINGVPQWVSGRPSVDKQTYDNPTFTTYNRGDTIQVLNTIGGTTGTAVLDIETYELVPRDQQVLEPGRLRFTRIKHKEQYLVRAPERHILQERWASLEEAARRVQSRGQSAGGFSVTPRGTSVGSVPGDRQPPRGGSGGGNDKPPPTGRR